jgi:hypothetical protein
MAIARYSLWRRELLRLSIVVTFKITLQNHPLNDPEKKTQKKCKRCNNTLQMIVQNHFGRI